MGTTDKLARFVVQARYEDIPHVAIERAKLCLLDTVGCAVYATTEPLGKIVMELVRELGGRQTSRVLGTDIVTNAPQAALANGTLGHALDFDDMGGGLHHGVLYTPVVLALGEQLRASGRDVLLAYLVGYEVTAKVAANIGADHYARGWHLTATAGTLGAAAAAAKLLGLDEEQTTMALGIATSEAAGIRANFGTMTKPLHPGNAARNGVMAALLAQKGYRASEEAMEHRFGFAAVYGDQQCNLAAMGRGLGRPWAIMGETDDEATHIAVKPWPCCGSNHAALTAVERLLEANSIEAEQVDVVDIATTMEPSCMAPCIHFPRNGLEGKFSTWYSVAAAILDGKVDLSTYTDEAVNRPRAQDLTKRVNIYQFAEYKGRPLRASGDVTYWDVTIRMRNGAEHSTRVYDHGRGLWGEEVVDKYRSLVDGILPDGQAEQSIRLIRGLEQVQDVTEVMDTVTLSVAVAAVAGGDG